MLRGGRTLFSAFLLMFGLALMLASCLGGDNDERDLDARDGNAETPSAIRQPPSGSLPTPDHDGEYLYNDLVFGKAQQLTDFELVRPTSIPQAFEFDGVYLKEQSEELPDLDQGLTAVFKFLPTADFEGPLVLTQQPYRSSLESGESLTVAGLDVSRREISDGQGSPIVTHLWRADDITYILTARMSTAVTQPDLENIIASMISARS